MHAGDARRQAQPRPRLRVFVAGLVVGVLSVVGCSPEESQPEPPPTDLERPPTDLEPPPPSVAPERAALSGPSVLSYAESAAWLDGMSADEQIEQIRDWTVVGLATLLELDVAAARDAFYDKTSMRDGVFAGVDDGHVGPGRSLADGRGALHLLVPADDPYADRTIGTLLDEHRKDAGDDEPSVQLHRYTIDQRSQQVQISSDAVSPTSDVRSAHGYIERKLDDRAALADFLSVIRHLSRVEMRAGDLWSAGWAWGDDIPGGIVTTDDIAVLLRGYLEQSTWPGFSLDPAPEGSLAELQAVLPDADPRVLERLWYERPRPTRADDEPGYVCDELIAVAAEYRTAGVDDLVIENAQTILECLLWGRVGLEAAPTVGLPADRTRQWAMSRWLSGHGTHSVARYDGRLAGTEVGMTLFYTDMVAKDWVAGVGSGLPSQAVPGFLADTETDIPWGHCDDAGAESGRLWFGQDDAAFSLRDDTLDIGAVATRLFSRSDSTGGEVEPSYSFGRGLGWWDRHYVAIADYEPQYHRLDQLMRWSAALEWAIYDQGWTEFVLPVDPNAPSARFDEWYRAHGELRERSDVAFVSPPGAMTEALMAKPTPPFELCRRVFIEGGVSLGDMLLRRAVATDAGLAIADELPAAVRRGGTFGAETTFDASTSSGTISRITVDASGAAVDQVTRRISPVVDDIVVNVDVDAYGTRSFGLGDIKLARDATVTRHVETTIAASTDRFERSFTIDDVALGRLTATKAANVVTLRWDDGPFGQIRQAWSRIQRAVRGGQSLDDAVMSAPGTWLRYKDPATGYWSARFGGDGSLWTRIDDAVGPSSASTPQIGVPGPLEDVIPYQLRDAPAPTLFLDEQPAEWYRIVGRDGAPGDTIIEPVPPPAETDGVIIVVQRDGQQGQYSVSAGGVLARVDDPLFGLDGTSEGAAMLRRHAELTAADAAAAGDGYARGVVLDDGGAVLLGPEGRVVIGDDDGWAEQIRSTPSAADGSPPLFRASGDQLLWVERRDLGQATVRATGPIDDVLADPAERGVTYVASRSTHQLLSEDGGWVPPALAENPNVTVSDYANPSVGPAPDILVDTEGVEWRRVNESSRTATSSNNFTLVEPVDECDTGSTGDDCPLTTGG